MQNKLCQTHVAEGSIAQPLQDYSVEMHTETLQSLKSSWQDLLSQPRQAVNALAFADCLLPKSKPEPGAFLAGYRIPLLKPSSRRSEFSGPRRLDERKPRRPASQETPMLQRTAVPLRSSVPAPMAMLLRAVAPLAIISSRSSQFVTQQSFGASHKPI